MTLDSEVQALKQVPMFSGVDPGRLKLLAFTGERVTFSDGQRLFGQGDPSDAAYVLLAGRALVQIDTPTGPLTVAEFSGHDLLGEMGILADATRSATVLAKGDVTALRLDKRVFLELLSQFPQMAIAVMRELAKRLERTNAKLASLSN